MQDNEKEVLAKSLASKAEKCVKILKFLAMAALALAVLLAVYSCAVFLTGAVTEYREAVLTGYIVIVAFIALFVAGTAITYFTAKTYLKKLDALDEKSGGENNRNA